MTTAQQDTAADIGFTGILAVAAFFLGAAGVPANAGPLDVPPPFGLSWGVALAQVGDYEKVEKTGGDTGATLLPPGVPGNILEVVGFFCSDSGLQQVQLVSGRYNRFDILRQFGVSLDALRRDLGPPDHGEPDIGTAYWGEALALEAYPATKTKFIIVTTYRGPNRATCTSMEE